jgi:hypothetical protein
MATGLLLLLFFTARQRKNLGKRMPPPLSLPLIK